MHTLKTRDTQYEQIYEDRKIVTLVKCKKVKCIDSIMKTV